MKLRDLLEKSIFEKEKLQPEVLFQPEALLQEQSILEIKEFILKEVVIPLETKFSSIGNLIPVVKPFNEYLIYCLNTQSLRGINSNSKKTPLGIYGEGLDVLLANLDKTEKQELEKHYQMISWLKHIEVDTEDEHKLAGHKPGRSGSKLYFKDKFMHEDNNLFSAENANEGALHILFYLTLFISHKTPAFFAVDNIESCLNPGLCRVLIKELAAISKKNGKQSLITTHNPAVLDGMNLFDEEQRLFIVARDDDGKTVVDRIKLKPPIEGKKLKLSEMWMRGLLGGLPRNF